LDEIFKIPIKHEMMMGYIMAQAVSGWRVNVEAQGQARANPCGICGEKSGTGDRFFIQLLQSFLIIIIIVPVLHTHLCIYYPYHIILANGGIIK
jgi:hypothetical protein